jgi:hypothetical protein
MSISFCFLCLLLSFGGGVDGISCRLSLRRRTVYKKQKYKKKRNRTNEIPFFLYLCTRKHYGGAFGWTAWGVADDYMEFIL